MDVWVSSVLAILHQQGNASALECAGEGTATVHADWNNLGQGWCCSLCNCVTFTLCPAHFAVSVKKEMHFFAVSPPQTLIISGEQDLCTYILDHVSSITHLLSPFWGEPLTKTTRIPGFAESYLV